MASSNPHTQSVFLAFSSYVSERCSDFGSEAVYLYIDTEEERGALGFILYHNGRIT